MKSIASWCPGPAKDQGPVMKQGSFPLKSTRPSCEESHTRTRSLLPSNPYAAVKDTGGNQRVPRPHSVLPFFPGAVVGSGLLQGPTHPVKSVFAALLHFFLHTLFSPSIQAVFHARLIRGSPRSDLRSHFLGGAITTAGVLRGRLPHGDTRGLGREHCSGTFVASTAAFDLHAGATSAAGQRAWRGGRAGGGLFGAGGCRRG